MTRGPDRTEGCGTVANQRSSNSRLLAIGFAVLVVGVLLVLVIIRNADDEPAQPSPVATDGQEQTDQPAEAETPLTPEQFSSSRLPLPLDVPEGTEAMAMRMNFVRSMAAIPAPGDRVNVYRFLSATGQDAEPAEGETGQAVGPSSSLPAPGPDSVLVLPEMQVLAVTGPLPAANDGNLTVVLAVPSDQVPGLMPLANDSQLWFTLLPSVDEEPTEAGTESTEEPA